jgi:NADH-quinone oxidoreductase subunit J
VLSHLFAQQTATLNPLELGAPILLGVVGYMLAAASPERNKNVPAVVCLLGAIFAAWFCWWQLEGEGKVIEDILFTSFAGLMVMAGCGMQVETRPVYSALWFALVILATCGLFLMQGAAFISAATIIVYAGAIVVTFLFVIMLARQGGKSNYDVRLMQPMLAMVTGGVLLAAMVYAIQQPVPEKTDVPSPGVNLSAPMESDLSTVAALGRSLFVDHLFAVELASILLLVAIFGTLVIALQSREQAR